MHKFLWADVLWGKQAKTLYLWVAALLLLFSFLSVREIWTQEHRWADIVAGMFYRHDFFHPYLGAVEYYDKPLLSYWLMAGLASLTGDLTTWTLRFPSACAGLLAVWSMYRLGSQLNNKQLGLLAGWLLLTTFYFIFWARTSSADMLNMAGALFAVAWYADHKAEPTWFSYAIFFLIIAVASLCKGLVAAVVACLVILPDVCIGREWKKHLQWRVLLSAIPAVLLYVIPFWLSTHVGGGHSYGESGLYEVYRENILRYFQPFDHVGPIYTYVLFLPIYLFPWIVFFIPTLVTLPKRWKTMSRNAKWMAWSVLLLFVFFSSSGSRRNYYVLPMVPFALLMTAEWLQSSGKWLRLAGASVCTVFLLLFVYVVLLQPFYYSEGSLSEFATRVKTVATMTKPWQQWRIEMLDAESKVGFYLAVSPDVKNYPVIGDRAAQQPASLLRAWPQLKTPSSDTIFISRKRYVYFLQTRLKNYTLIETAPVIQLPFFTKNNEDAPVAFIPHNPNRSH